MISHSGPGLLVNLWKEGTAATLTMYQPNNSGTFTVLSSNWATPDIESTTWVHGGNHTEILDGLGDVCGFVQNGEYVEMTWTIVPKNTTQALALERMALPEQGGVCEIANAPTVKFGRFTDVFNYDGALDTSPVTNVAPWFYISGQWNGAHNDRVSGTVTLRRYPGILSPFYNYKSY